MKGRALLAVFCLAAASVSADPGFWSRASGLLGQGKVDEAGALARSVLQTSPDDPDALVVTGTVLLYQKMTPRRDDSIYHPNAEPEAAPVPTLTSAGADAVASVWQRVPLLDASRTYLWGDLAQLMFRAGASDRAVPFALRALASPAADADTLRAAASVFLLTLDTRRAAEALEKRPGDRTALLYRGLDMWKSGQDGWRVPLRAFVNAAESLPGQQLAAYLIGPAMRDSEAGFVAAIQAEPNVPAALVVRQKYASRYPNKYLARLDLARSLSQFGSYAAAIHEYDEIDRLQLASNAEERMAVLFQQAWAQQSYGRWDEASRLWARVFASRDFYLRSAAAWFLGSNAAAAGNLGEAKDWWSKVADEPARSKYAFWADQELKTAR